MSVAFKPGQALTENDLKIAIRDSGGNLVDPSYIRYSLFDVTTGVEVLIGSADRIPATSGTGLFHVDATIPLDSNIGDWLVRWNFRETPTSPLVEVIQEFNVVEESVTVSVTGDAVADEYIRRLRILLRDNNPDRNYSVSGKEKVKIKAGNKFYTVSIGELYKIIEDGDNDKL